MKQKILSLILTTSFLLTIISGCSRTNSENESGTTSVNEAAVSSDGAAEISANDTLISENSKESSEGSTEAAEEPDFITKNLTIQNSTGEDYSEVYLKAAVDEKWQKIQLDDDDTLSGDNEAITLSVKYLEEEPLWDIKCVTSDGSEREFKDVDLTRSSSEIYIELDHNDDDYSVVNWYVNVPLTFKNNTGASLKEIYISQNSSEDWGSNILELASVDQLDDGYTYNVTYSFAENNSAADVKVVTDKGEEIEFTDMDLNSADRNNIIIDLTNTGEGNYEASFVSE